MTDVTPELRAQMRASLVNSDDTRTLCGVRFVDLLAALDVAEARDVALCEDAKTILAERDALQARLTATVAMIVGRLGGGAHELNYLQRVDILRAIEKAAHRLLLALGPATESMPTCLVKTLNDMLLALDARPS